MSDGNLLFKGQYTLDFGAEAVAEGKVQPVVSSASASAAASASASAEATEPSEDALVSGEATAASASPSAAGPASQVTVQECDFTLIRRCGS